MAIEAVLDELDRRQPAVFDPEQQVEDLGRFLALPRFGLHGHVAVDR